MHIVSETKGFTYILELNGVFERNRKSLSYYAKLVSFTDKKLGLNELQSLVTYELGAIKLKSGKWQLCCYNAKRTEYDDETCDTIVSAPIGGKSTILQGAA